MYFPYLRGRQEEMLALVGLANVLGRSRLTVPIVKPFSFSNAFVNRCRRIAQSNVRFAVVANSDEGRPPPRFSTVAAFLSDSVSSFPSTVFPAFEIRPTTTANEVATFVQQFPASQVIFVHRNHSMTPNQFQNATRGLNTVPVQVYLDGGTPSTLRNSLPAIGKVLLRDGFQLHTPNVNYPPQQFFDDLVFVYNRFGYDGFGDFTIVGDVAAIRRGPALNIVLHLTTPTQVPSLITQHFVSTTPRTIRNPQAKFFNALNQLLNFTGNPPLAPFATLGVDAYVNCHNTRHYPGLGCLKRWSIMHHLETVDTILNNSNATPFI